MFDSVKPLTDRKVLDYALGEPPARMDLTAVEAVDGRVIVFARTEAGASIVVRHEDGRTWPLAQELVRHSPTGLEFGYAGSGPADTALNVLSLVVSPREANRLHQKFKFDHIATIPREGGELTLAAVREWIGIEYRAEMADPVKMNDEREARELFAEVEADDPREPDTTEYEGKYHAPRRAR